MAFTRLEPQPPMASEAAPGLAAGEIALRLDSGHKVAVLISARRLASGRGVAIAAAARWLHGDGRPRFDAHDQEVRTRLSHTASAVEVDRHGLAAMQKAALLAVLGEEPEPVQAQGEDEAHPLIALSPELALQVSIRHALAAAVAVAEEPGAAALLGIG